MTYHAITVQDLGKRYRLGVRVRHGRNFRDAVLHAAAAPMRRLKALRDAHGSGDDTFWALKGVSLEIAAGSVVGVIGRNGAGKSTLLKVLSRITEPTEGEVWLRGRVASLLEVGTGFHPELTGRENVYLNGAILGMRRREIDRKFDQIVSFAEVDKFLDTPVKHYSSGMYVRLAFAVAAHLEPDILVVDEVLAVGDAAFQDKCLGRIQEVSRGEGRTVLFVSHNMGAVARLCDRAIWLDQGRVVADEPAATAIKRYLSLNLLPASVWSRPDDPSESSPVRFLRVATVDDTGQPRANFAGNDPIMIEIDYEVYVPLQRCQIGARISNGQALAVFSTSDSDAAGVAAQPRRPGVYRARFTISPHFLPPESYSVQVAAHEPFRRIFEVHDATVRFEVTNVNSLVAFDHRAGAVAPLLTWECRALNRAIADIRPAAVIGSVPTA
jgi:lipopolysaccharide transport system ATP-binding protein